MKNVTPHLAIIRPNVCLLAIFAFVVGTILLSNFVKIGLIKMISALVAVWFICAGGNVINDYFDRDIDRVNRPNRPIPSGSVSPKDALAYYLILNLIAIIFALKVTIYFLMLAIFNILISFIYSYKLKRTFVVGNVVDSYLASVCFVAPLFLTNLYEPKALYSLVLLGMIAFFGNLGREVIKDIEDKKGDKKLGARTIPIVLNDDVAWLISKISIIGALILAIFPILMGITSLLYLLGFIPCTYFSISAISHKGNAANAQKRIKLAMFSLIFGFILGTVF